MRQLTGPEKGILQRALDAHYDIMTIRPFTEVRLDKKFLSLVSPLSRFDVQLFEFVTAANQKGWHGKLINAILAENPENEELLKLAYELGIAGQAYQKEESDTALNINGLEQLVNANPFMDIAVMLRELAKIERCVCRIEVEKDSGSSWGTGFLVGPDLLLTNYHVLEAWIKSPDTVQAVSCLFDYKILPDGSSINPGLRIALADDALLASSGYSDLDVQGSANLDVAWPADKLDYALVRLPRKIGEEAFGPMPGGSPMSQTTRSWIKPAAHPVNLFSGGHVIIVQHPEGSPQKVAFGFSQSGGTDAARLRLRYKVNTLKGSSGSPCFNEKFQWVALHNMGDPNWNPQYNQGVVAQRIIDDLNAKGFAL